NKPYQNIEFIHEAKKEFQAQGKTITRTLHKTAFMIEKGNGEINKVLNRINATSKSLQEITANLNIACTLYESLMGFVQELRNDFDSIEEQVKEICGNFTDAIYSTDFQRSRKRKCKFDDNCDDDIQFSAKNNFKINTFYVMCDSLVNELIRRKTAYASINNILKFLFTETDTHSADCFEVINNMYKTDIYIHEIQDEWHQFNAILR
ncbi:hypothetical protein ILUMI_26283, partial [Ignelater luminosus]